MSRAARRKRQDAAAAVRDLASRFPPPSRPITATKANLASLRLPCVTVKLDGVRVVLLVAGGHLFCKRHLTARDRVFVAAVNVGPGLETILDAELIDDHYYVFDALCVGGEDVTQLPILERLRLASKLPLPPTVVFKTFLCGFADGLASRLKRMETATFRLADGRRLRQLEGFIFCDFAAPYQHAPLKFKNVITFDFALSKKRRRANREDGVFYDLLTASSDGSLVRLDASERFPSISSSLFVTKSEEEEHELRETDTHVVVVECALSAKGRWSLLRRRKDRNWPNSERVIATNLEALRAGDDDLAAVLAPFPGEPSAKSEFFCKHFFPALKTSLEREAARLRLPPTDDFLFFPALKELRGSAIILTHECPRQAAHWRRFSNLPPAGEDICGVCDVVSAKAIGFHADDRALEPCLHHLVRPWRREDGRPSLYGIRAIVYSRATTPKPA